MEVQQPKRYGRNIHPDQEEGWRRAVRQRRLATGQRLADTERGRIVEQGRPGCS